MTDIDVELTLEQKHRKEKKDLQAKIQGLKKLASKSDKKKKKEIQDDILRLETDLEARHLEELSLNNSESPLDNELNQNNEVVPRISKAQKRRDKKAADEREREKLILEQEIENIHGPRNVETKTIKGLLSARGLVLHTIPSNGDCLYGAVTHQLSITNRSSLSVANLRKSTADHIRKHKDDYLPFLSDLDTGDMLTDQQFEDYCDKIANTTTWGGQVELRALSDILKCTIQVLQSTLPPVITQGEEYKGTPLIITYHRHMYSLGEHYNSTQVAANVENQDGEFTTS